MYVKQCRCIFLVWLLGPCQAIALATATCWEMLVHNPMLPHCKNMWVWCLVLNSVPPVHGPKPEI
jgi:hypothetical protein